MNVGRYILLVLSIALCAKSNAQVIEFQRLPAAWNTYQVSVNPALCHSDFNNLIQLNYSGYTGLRKNIRTIDANYIKRIGSNSNQYIGIIGQSDWVNKYISKNRLHALYSIAIPMNENQKLRAGLTIGTYNYNVNDNPTQVLGSETVIDGNLGLAFEHKESLIIGLGLHQFPNVTIQPIYSEQTLPRYPIANAMYKIDINEVSGVRLMAYYRRLPDFEDHYSTIALYFRKFQTIKIESGINFDNIRGIDGLVIIDGIGTKLRNYLLSMAYNIPFNSGLSGSQTIQFGLNFRF